MTLLSQLENYKQKNIYPMHMPGHKRRTDLLLNSLPWDIDITEIEGFDNLHNPQGILAECENKASILWNCDKSYFLVGGSTAGILAGIYAVCGGGGGGGKILVARNCHKSVYHAIEICGLEPCFLVSDVVSPLGFCGSISPESVKTALEENGDIKLAVITSPTYEGVLSDIISIADILHLRNIPLMVDEAHGAHLGLFSKFFQNAIQCGADIVIHSVHKTLPSLTQTAIAHISEKYISNEKMRHALGIFQTSSPSYPLMASIDNCVTLMRDNGKELLNSWQDRLNDFYAKTSKLSKLSVFNSEDSSIFQRDSGKIIISTFGTNITGPKLSSILLNSYGIQLEMASGNYALAMTSLCDTGEGFAKLSSALIDIDRTLSHTITAPALNPVYLTGKQELSVSEAAFSDGLDIPISQSAGMISLDYIWAYPPGIPVIIPGQRITTEAVSYILNLLELGVTVSRGSSKNPTEIKVAPNS